MSGEHLEPETHDEDLTPESGWHRVNIGHLVMGTAFLGLTAVWVLVVGTEAVDLEETHWLLPLPWLVAGAVGLVASALRGRRSPGPGRMSGWH